MRIDNVQRRDYLDYIRRLSQAAYLGFEPLFTVEEAEEAFAEGHQLGLKNIVGFGFGVKMVRGAPRDELVICGYVVRKVPLDAVEPGFSIEQRVRDVLGFDISTDVLEVGRPAAYHHDNQEYTRRIPGGVTVSNQQLGMLGTLGGWLKDSKGKPHLLTCWHCLDGGAGGSDIFQPKTWKIATLRGGVGPESNPQSGRPTVDAAVAKLDDEKFLGDLILGIGEIRGILDITNQTLPLQVRKYGRTSHLTSGSVVHASAILALNMHANVQVQKNPVVYEEQLLIYPGSTQASFSAKGDSGALVMTEDHCVVGLLVGGGPAVLTNGPVSIATPIIPVLDELQSELQEPFEFIIYP
jgi:hypothetical protein